MIFKTFNTDIDKSIAKIGMFNKSFWAMQQDLKHGNGLAFSIFGGQSATSKDKQAILDLNTQLQSGVNPGKAWATTMTNCSIAAQTQARQCLKAKGSLTELANGFENVTLSAKAGQVVLRGLSIAGNMLIGWAITAAIKLLVNALDNAADSLEDVESRIQDNQSKLSDYTSKVEELTKRLEELNQTNVKYFSEDEREELEREASYIDSQIKLYNQLSEAKQKAINDDYIKAAMGSNQELYYKKAWEYISNEFDEYGLESLFHNPPKELRLGAQDAFFPITTLFRKVDDGNYITEANKLLDEYQKLQDKSISLQNFAIENGSNEALDNNIEETQYKIHQTADELSQFIEKIQTARDALYNSENRNDYADIIAEMDDAIANYQNIFSGNIYTSKKNGTTDLQRDLIGIRDVLQTISQDIGGLTIFEPIIDEINKLIDIIKLLDNYSFEEILNLDKILLSDKLNDIQEQIRNFKDTITNKEFSNELNTALYHFMPPELIEQWEKLQDTIKNIREQIGGLIQYVDSKTGLSDIFSVLEERLNNIYDFLSDIMDRFGWIFNDAIEAWKSAHNIEIKSGNKSEKIEDKEEQNYTQKGKFTSFTAFTEEQSKAIDDFQAKVKTLGDTISSIQSGDTIDFTDLIQEFPELAGQSDNLEQAITDLIYHSLQELYDTLGEGLPDEVKNDLQSIADTAAGVTPQLDTAFSAIQKSYDALQDFKDAMSAGMTNDALSSVASLSAKLNDLVAGFYAGTVSADDLYEALKEHYNTDLNNYGNALIAKNELSGEFYNSVVLNNTEFVNKFKDDYGIDLNNYKSYHQAKLDIAVNTIEALGENWSKYYDAQALALTADGKRLLSTLSQSSSKESHEQYAEIMSQISQFEQAKKAMNDLNHVVYDGIDAKFSSISNGFTKNSSSARSEFSETIDFFERRIEVLDSSLDQLSAGLENVAGSFAKNSIIDARMDINQEKIRNYTDALAMYSGEAQKILSSIPSDIAEKVRNGAVSLTDFVGDGNESVVEAIKDYEAWAKKISDCNQNLTALQKTIAQLELDRFNNIAQDFDDQYDLRDSAIGNIDKQIALLEEMGELVGKSYYEAQKSLAEKQLETLTGERTALANELADALASGNIQAGSDEWLSMVKSLAYVDGKIIDCKKDIEAYDNAILQLDWNTFDRQQEAVSNVQSELGNLASLFDDIDVADDSTGEWTDDALAKLGLLAEQYEAAQVSVSDYNNAINQLKQDYADGKYSATEYAEKLAKLNDGQWEAIKASKSAEDAIVELNKARIDEIIEGIEKEKEAYKELVDAQIKALDSEKNLHDYKKSIQEKSQTVTDIKKKIAAVQTDDSAYGKALKLKYEEELAEAQKELEEAEYEHSIEEQKEALNQQYEDFETEKDKEIEALKESLNDIEKLIAKSFDAVKQNAATIGERIAEVAREHGISVSDAVVSPWQNGQNAIAGYGETLSASTSAFAGNLGTIKAEAEALQTQADNASKGYAFLFEQKSDDLVTQLKNAYTATENLYKMTKALGELPEPASGSDHDVSKDNNTSVPDTTGKNNNKSPSDTGGSNKSDTGNNVLNGAASSASSGIENAIKSDTKNNSTVQKRYKIVDKNGNPVGSTSYSSAQEASEKLRELNQKNGGGYSLRKYSGGTRHTEGELLIKDEEGYELGLPKLANGNYALMPEGSQILTKAQTDNLFEWAKRNPVSLIPDFTLPKLPEIAQGNVNQPVSIQSNITFTGAVNDADSFAKDIARIADRQVEKSWKKATDSLKY